jgi:hypothetical protein
MKIGRKNWVGGAYGVEIAPPDERPSVVDDGLFATAERIQHARRFWPQGRAEDFERVGKRRYRNRATGVVYRHEDGCPLLNIGFGGTAQEDLDLFLVSGGRLIFLQNEAIPQGRSVVHGAVRGGEVVNGQIQWRE